MTKRTCSIDGCSNKHSARGFCNAHYQKFLKHGDPLYQPVYSKDTVCSIGGCKKSVLARNFCVTHYSRWRANGDPEKLINLNDPAESIKVHVSQEGECSVWTRGKTGSGYGAMQVNGRTIGAHVYAWEQANGPIPDGLFIDHRCHNTACVRLEHLRLSTPQQNTSNRSGPGAGSASGVRNVHRHRNGWRVSITKNGKHHNFGKYSTIAEAAIVAERAREELFGDYAGRG